MDKQESSLRERFYDEFLDSFKGLFFITDLNGNIINISDNTNQLLSCSDKEEILGKKIFQFLIPKDSILFQKCFKKAKKNELNKTIEFRFHGKNSSYLRGNANFLNIKDNLGQSKYIIVMVTNVDRIPSEEQNQSSIENELSRSQEMLELVINNIPQYIFWKNIDCEFLGCNDNFANAAGFETPKKIIGKTDFDLAWKISEAESFFETDKLVMETGIPEYNIIEKQSMANGKEAWLSINKIPLKDSAGNVIGLLGTYEDITERIENQNRIKNSERRYKKAYNRAEFYKDVFTHDISNILQSLLSSIELCKLHLASSKNKSEPKNMMDLMVEQINRGAILVENIKKLSRIDEERIVRKINLNDVLNEAISYIKRKYNEKIINIKVTPQENNLYVLGNNFLIDVFKNLFRNSVKYNKHSHINIQIEVVKIQEASENFLKVEVIDNGKGIPKTQKQAIMQEKIGENKSLKRIGLGLALVNKIINSIHGRFQISNRVKERPTKGTKFTILIPEA